MRLLAVGVGAGRRYNPQVEPLYFDEKLDMHGFCERIVKFQS